METPVFRLGLVGFNEREEQSLRISIAAYREVQWRCGRAEGADAWIIKGARIGRVLDSRVRVIPTDGTGAAYLLDVTSRPVAVAMPAPEQVRPLLPLFFDPTQDGGIGAALAGLDAQSARLRRQYWTASHLVEHNASIGKAAYQLSAGTQVLAATDMKETVFISPDATAELLDQAVWVHRARKMVEVPPAFERHSLSELLWVYATRSQRELLPARYREHPIYLRRPPRVPQELVGDVHLSIIRELAVVEGTLASLVHRIGVDGNTVAQSLAALYLVGSVTTNPERACSVSDGATLWSRAASVHDALPLRDDAPSTTPLL